MTAISPSPFHLKGRKDMSFCKVCGKKLTGRQVNYCSRKCNKLGGKRRRSGLPENVRPKRSHIEWTDDDIQNRINTKSDRMVYIGGYVGSEGYMYLYCSDCGQAFRWSATGLRRQRLIQCDNCLDILSRIKEEEYRNQIERNKIISKEKSVQKKIEAEQVKEQSKHHYCLRCGKEFIGKAQSRYCSAICQRRQADSTRSHVRRMQAMSKVHDVISPDLLYERDKGICWLCGKATDKTDKTVRPDGVTIVHDNYPTVDHVIPLKHGGTHTWDNVRLAHFKCNSLRGASLVVEKKDGQMSLAI